MDVVVLLNTVQVDTLLLLSNIITNDWFCGNTRWHHWTITPVAVLGVGEALQMSTAVNLTFIRILIWSIASLYLKDELRLAYYVS